MLNLGAIMNQTNLKRADLTGCFVHGLSAWDVILDETIQKDLVITDVERQAVVTVDDLEVAHFMYICSTIRRFGTSSTPLHQSIRKS